METEAIVEEEGAQGDAGNATVVEDMAGADEPAAEETAPTADAAAGEGDGGHTAGPEAAGASSAAPAADPSAGKEQSGIYLEAPNGVFIQVPWGSSSRAPVEGETFDGEVLASAGLKIVEAPGGSDEPEEEKLLRRLLALYRARQAKLESREALTAKAGADLEKRAAELRAANQAALRDLAEERERLAGEHQEFLLEKAKAEEQQRLAGEELSRREGALNQRKVDLDAHEDDLTAREQAIGGALKEAKDTAGTAETAKKDLEAKVQKLELFLKASEDRVTALNVEREKDAHTNSDLQVRLSKKGDELTAAKDSIADLELKVSTLTDSLDAARDRETKLKDELRKERNLVESAAVSASNFSRAVEQWTDELVTSAANIDMEMMALRAEHLVYSPDENLPHSAKLSLFFRGIAPALARLREKLPVQLADELRRLCAGTLERVLTKIVYRNPGINLVNVLRTLPDDADQEALKAQVAHIIAKVNKISRIEGDRVD